MKAELKKKMKDILTFPSKMMSVKDIRPYARNPRKNDDAVKAVMRSIEDFGFLQPIVIDKDGIIIVGHTRFKAAKALDMKEVPVIVADHLTDDEAKAYRIADNSTGDLADWDEVFLREEVGEVTDMDLSDYGLDMSPFEDVDSAPPVKTVETAPFRKAYVLVVADLDAYDRVAPIVDELKLIPGVELTYAVKTD